MAPEPERIATVLAELFEGHGIECARHGDWVAPRGTLPAVRGHWTPGARLGRLDIEVKVDAHTTIVESCAGVASNGARTDLDDALRNFTINSFHVLLSALWRLDDPDQVAFESWTIDGTPFTAVIGNFATRGSAGHAAPPVPHTLFPAIERAIRSEPLPARLHWFRFYFGTVKGDPIFEALRDNEPWEAGVEALKSVDWEPTDAFYSARLFLMLRPAAD